MVCRITLPPPPLHSSAVAEVVLQLHRLEELRFVTANKGLTAAYTLDDFFDEQARSAIRHSLSTSTVLFHPTDVTNICCTGLVAMRSTQFFIRDVRLGHVEYCFADIDNTVVFRQCRVLPPTDSSLDKRPIEANACSQRDLGCGAFSECSKVVQ